MQPNWTCTLISLKCETTEKTVLNQLWFTSSINSLCEQKCAKETFYSSSMLRKQNMRNINKLAHLGFVLKNVIRKVKKIL